MPMGRPVRLCPLQDRTAWITPITGVLSADVISCTRIDENTPGFVVKNGGKKS